jgi:hypothetical protein
MVIIALVAMQGTVPKKVLVFFPQKNSEFGNAKVT